LPGLGSCLPPHPAVGVLPCSPPVERGNFDNAPTFWPAIGGGAAFAPEDLPRKPGQCRIRPSLVRG
ncbi:MAG: hypothetical protein J2P25_06650, partial [Nocardiopsaceae bacterium]|nr:hypothetical protein [Nocardiopsaceae bacterium]